MITSLIEMLELPGLGNMTTSTIQFESLDNILFVTSQTVANFASTIKITIGFIKTTLQDSNEVKRTTNLNMAYLAYFWWKNADVSKTERVCHVIC